MLLILFSILFGNVNTASPEWRNDIRRQYFRAVHHESTRNELHESMKGLCETGDPFVLAYHGATLCLLAESSMVPWTKYSRFTEGTAKLEKAIAMRPHDPEFRCLRFLIQYNVPAFLSYDAMLHEDYVFVQEALIKAEINGIWSAQFTKFATMHARAIEVKIKQVK